MVVGGCGGKRSVWGGNVVKLDLAGRGGKCVLAGMAKKWWGITSTGERSDTGSSRGRDGSSGEWGKRERMAQGSFL